MQTIRGHFNGRSIELLEEVPIEGESHVLITFLDGSLETAAAREQRLGTFSEPLQPLHIYGPEMWRQMAAKYRRFTVGGIMTRRIITVPHTTQVTAALNLMRQQGISSIMVEPQDDGEWGIMTMRDVLKQIVMANRSPEEVTVGEIASHPLIQVSPDMNLHDCTERMIELNIRRVAVTEEGRPVGIISDTDIFQFVEEHGWGPEFPTAV
ncbi:MAG: CBS domain-containing protein [Chloroflexaceae bacterium]|nr:CBS domain-containing protein [Chloroflexaceae bacterium]